MELTNKVVFITGSSIGIGREDAKSFAKEGVKLVITYNTHKEEVGELANECKKLGSPEVLVFKLNILDDKSIKNVVDKIIQKYNRIDVLINNAGIVIWKPFKEQTFKQIESQLRVNIEGLVKMTKIVLPYLNEVLINIGSTAGFIGEEYLTTYCASKWAVRGFTKSLALELPNLRIYCVNPPGVATQMNDFQGLPPEKVSGVIVRLVKGSLNKKSGDDVNILDYI